MSYLHPAVKAVVIAVAAPLGLYCVFLGLGMTPFFQRQYVWVVYHCEVNRF